MHTDQRASALLNSSVNISLIPFSNTSSIQSRSSFPTDASYELGNVTQLGTSSQLVMFANGSPATSRAVDVCVSQHYDAVRYDIRPPLDSTNNPHPRQLLDWEFPVFSYPYDWASYSAANHSFSSFGRDPACTSAFSSFAASHPSTITTFTEIIPVKLADGQTSISSSLHADTVPVADVGYCCTFGANISCWVASDSLQMVYFPPPRPNTACLVESVDSFSNNTQSSKQATNMTALPDTNSSIFATGSDGFI